MEVDMKLVDMKQVIAIVSVIGVESFPCDMVGQKKIFTLNGEGQTGNLKLPWNLPMTWIEEQLAELVTGNQSNEVFKFAELINPDEPDQIVKVKIDFYLPPHKLIGGINE